MTFLIRVLRDKEWFEPINPDLALSRENTRADAAANFCAQRCRLSFFRVEDGVSVERIATAVAASRAGLDDVEYCLLEQVDVENVGCRLDSSVAGDTLMADINALHIDVCDVNLIKLIELSFVAATRGETGRVRSKQVRKLLRYSIDHGELDVNKLKLGLRKGVE